MLQWCIWRSSKVIGNDNIRYNAHKFVLVFHCNDGHIAVSSHSGRKSTDARHKLWSITSFHAPFRLNNLEKTVANILTFFHSCGRSLHVRSCRQVLCLLTAQTGYRQTDVRQTDRQTDVRRQTDRCETDRRTWDRQTDVRQTDGRETDRRT